MALIAKLFVVLVLQAAQAGKLDFCSMASAAKSQFGQLTAKISTHKAGPYNSRSTYSGIVVYKIDNDVNFRYPIHSWGGRFFHVSIQKTSDWPSGAKGRVGQGLVHDYHTKSFTGREYNSGRLCAAGFAVLKGQLRFSSIWLNLNSHASWCRGDGSHFMSKQEQAFLEPVVRQWMRGESDVYTFHNSLLHRHCSGEERLASGRWHWIMSQFSHSGDSTMEVVPKTKVTDGRCSSCGATVYPLVAGIVLCVFCLKAAAGKMHSQKATKEQKEQKENKDKVPQTLSVRQRWSPDGDAGPTVLNLAPGASGAGRLDDLIAALRPGAAGQDAAIQLCGVLRQGGNDTAEAAVQLGAVVHGALLPAFLYRMVAGPSLSLGDQRHMTQGVLTEFA